MLQNIIQFMKNQPDRSLGVVVMNQSQMEQIDGMMIRAAELDSDGGRIILIVGHPEMRDFKSFS